MVLAITNLYSVMISLLGVFYSTRGFRSGIYAGGYGSFTVVPVDGGLCCWFTLVAVMRWLCDDAKTGFLFFAHIA